MNIPMEQRYDIIKKIIIIIMIIVIICYNVVTEKLASLFSSLTPISSLIVIIFEIEYETRQDGKAIHTEREPTVTYIESFVIALM